MINRIREWIDGYWNHIVIYGYMGIFVLLIIVGIICAIGRFITVANSDIPTWLKWELLTR